MKEVWKSDLTMANWKVRKKIEQWLETMTDGEKWRLIVEGARGHLRL